MSTTLADLLWGRDARSRPWLRRTTASGLMYLVACLIQAWGAHAGLISPRAAAAVIGWQLAGFGLAYALLRSGLSARLRDPALTLWQILLALSVLVLNYALVQVSRPIAMPLLCLVLVFGMYSLSPTQILLAGGSAVAMLVGMLVFMSRAHVPDFDAGQQALNVALAAITLPVLAVVARQVALMRHRQVQQQAEMDEAIVRLNELATRDGLTGLANRRQMASRLEQEVQRMARNARPFCVLLLDIDGFKQINDQHGHATGDGVLVAFSRQLEQVFPDPDATSRWGGEEFLVLMPETSGRRALEATQRLLDGLSIRLPAADGAQRARVTFSGGVAQAAPGEPLERVVARADAALYQAKHQGRNQVIAAA